MTPISFSPPNMYIGDCGGSADTRRTHSGAFMYRGVCPCIPVCQLEGPETRSRYASTYALPDMIVATRTHGPIQLDSWRSDTHLFTRLHVYPFLTLSICANFTQKHPPKSDTQRLLLPSHVGSSMRFCY